LPPPYTVKIKELTCQQALWRERWWENEARKKKRKDQKTLCHDQDLNSWTLSPELNTQSIRSQLKCPNLQSQVKIKESASKANSCKKISLKRCT